jgi:hypothetical protein
MAWRDFGKSVNEPPIFITVAVLTRPVHHSPGDIPMLLQRLFVADQA